MTNLINKITKNATIPILVGALGINGYENKEKSKKTFFSKIAKAIGINWYKNKEKSKKILFSKLDEIWLEQRARIIVYGPTKALTKSNVIKHPYLNEFDLSAPKYNAAGLIDYFLCTPEKAKLLKSIFIKNPIYLN